LLQYRNTWLLKNNSLINSHSTIMADSVPEVEGSPLWLIASEESRECLLLALERNEWRPEIERMRPEPSLAEERLWCDANLLERIVEIKKEMNSHEGNDLDGVRKGGNPHEALLENRLMLGRYSMLLASIDRATHFLLTGENIDDVVMKRPLDTRPRGKNIHRDADIFYFAESQTLPVPFASQYIWLRKGFYNAKCFCPQFSPTSPLSALVSHSFLDTMRRVAHKKQEEQNESCNPYDPLMRETFTELIQRGTGGQGVHLYTGFIHNVTPWGEKQGEEGTSTHSPPLVTRAAKEVMFRDSYLGQLLYATGVVRNGGRAVIHFLDTNTSLSMAVLYLAHIVFDRVAIYKPRTSRPGNTERFLICDGLRPKEAKAVKKYIEESLEKVRQGEYLVRLLPDRIMDEDGNFIEYARETNNKLAERQFRFLSSCVRMLKDEEREKVHEDCLETCLPYYLIPYATRDEMVNYREEMKSRSAMDILSFWIPHQLNPADLLLSLCSKNEAINSQILKKKVESEGRLLVTPCADLSSTLIVGTNNGLDFWSGKWKKWMGLSRFTTILPPDSVLIGDIIETAGGSTLIVRILDVGVIFGDDISNLPFKKRLRAAEKLVEATRKDGARQDVIISVAKYEEVDRGFRPNSISDRVVEDDIYFMKKRIFVVKESNASFYNMACGENIWEIYE
ncbi:hypothetical protein PMAYCL1PPCAC_29199, partial [Pristionchus mayeri]